MTISASDKLRFINKLEEQLQFIERSCATYDQGEENEALRLATSLRVIFHHTNMSVSLVAHLEFDDKKMLSSSRGHDDWKDYLSHQINLSSAQPIKMLPILGEQFHELSIEDWWRNETVFVHNGKNHSRRKIILSAANKDGGAHVDDELEEYYKFLCAGEYAFGITGNLEYDGAPPFPQGVTIYPNNAHLALIRQFAHEALTSVHHFHWLK